MDSKTLVAIVVGSAVGLLAPRLGRQANPVFEAVPTVGGVSVGRHEEQAGATLGRQPLTVGRLSRPPQDDDVQRDLGFGDDDHNPFV